MQPILSIILPLYNEEKSLPRILNRLLRDLKLIGCPFEILCCENGSSDKTKLIIQRWSQRHSEIHFLVHSKPNYGKALKMGILKSRGKYVAVINADLHDLKFLKTALTFLPQTDLVLGSKCLIAGCDQRPFSRRLITKFFNLLLRLFFNLKSSDTHGLKVFVRKKILPLVTESFLDKGMLDTELVLLAERHQLKIKELPIYVREKRRTSRGVLKRVPGWMIQCFQLYRAMKKHKIKLKEYYFDQIAQDVEGKGNKYDREKRLKIVFSCFNDLKGKKVLDAGCGIGRLSRKAEQLGAEVTALDIGTNLLKEVKKKCNARCVVGNICQLPFKSRRFDVVICSEVLEHTDGQEAAVRELARVLKPEGLLVITTPNFIWYPCLYLVQLFNLRKFKGKEKWMSWWKLKSSVKRNNLKIIKMFGFHSLPFIHPKLYKLVDYLDEKFAFTLGAVMLNICVVCTKE